MGDLETALTQSGAQSSSVGAVVCAYSFTRWDVLRRAIASLDAQTRALDSIVVVIDHNDALFEHVRREFPQHLVVENEGMRGVSGARNAGVDGRLFGSVSNFDIAEVLKAQGLDVDVKVTSDPQTVRDAHRVVLPGQGAMRDCMRHLSESGLREVVEQAAVSKPLLGVCVGMQMLLDHSAEGKIGRAHV